MSHREGDDQTMPAMFPLVLDEVCFEAAGQSLIDHISCELEAQPYTLVLGPNGAGKSLLLRLDPAVHAALARWAADELRSTTAQIPASRMAAYPITSSSAVANGASLSASVFAS